jgi:hypothetical protein
MRKGIILISIGIALLAIDIGIPMGDFYPPMEYVEDLGGAIQSLTINNIIGTRLEVDIFPDILGYALLFIGALLLLKYRFKAIIGMLLIPYAIYLSIIIMRLPYNFILRDLYLKAAGYHFLIAIIEILIETFIIKGVVELVRCTQTRWNVNELLFGWILAMISKGILSGIHFFFGMGILYYLYSLVMIGATAFYLNRLYVVTKFKLEENS